MYSQTEKLKLSNICKGKCAFGVAVYDLALFVDLRKHRVCDTNDKCITSDCSRSLHKARHSSDCNRWNGRMVGSKSILYSIPIPSELFTISFVNNVCFIIIFILLWGSVNTLNSQLVFNWLTHLVASSVLVQFQLHCTGNYHLLKKSESHQVKSEDMLHILHGSLECFAATLWYPEIFS